MKRLTKLALITPVAVVLALAVGGCASAQPKRQAMVCPECKMAETAVDNSKWEPDQAPMHMATTRIEHSCPGCQGYMKTLFKQGKLQHQCAICAQGSASCPASHRL